MKKSILLTLVIFMAINYSFAQKKFIKWGKVSPEELAMTTYEKDSSASAVILADFGQTSIEYIGEDFKTIFKHHRRIKILNEAGFEYGDIEIPFYSKRKVEKVIKFEAQVIAPDGTVSKISKADVFEEKVNDYWSQKKASLPNLAPGSIIEYKYEVHSERIFELREWYFQEGIPIAHSQLNVTIPEWFDYIYLFQGNNSFTKKESTTLQGALAGRTIQFTKTEYIIKDVPALKQERYITTMDDYLARVRFQLNATNFPGSFYKAYLSTWEELAENLMEDTDFALQYTKKKNYSSLAKDAEGLLQKDWTQEQKTYALSNFIMSNMEWNGRYSAYARGNLNAFYADKVGYSATLNLALIALLRDAGIKADPVMISTRENGKMVPLYPIIDQFNHTLVQAELDGEIKFIDLSNKFRPIGYPKVSSLNGMGWLVKETGSQWIELKAPGGNEAFMMSFDLTEEGDLVGKMTGSYSGYSAVSERRSYFEDKNAKHWKERFSENYPDVEVTAKETENLTDLSQKFKDNIDITLPEAAQTNGDFIYLSPVVYTKFDENFFKLEKRSYPVDIPYPFKEQYVLSLTIPDGYQVEELPEAVNVALPNKAGRFQFSATAMNKNQIQLLSKITVSQTKYEVEEYPFIKEFFDLIVEKHAEQIVLKKS